MPQLRFHLLIIKLSLIICGSCALLSCSNSREEELAAALESVQIDQQLYEIRLSLAEEELGQHRARLDGLQNAVENIVNPLRPESTASARPKAAAAVRKDSSGESPLRKQTAAASASPAKQSYDKALATLLGGNPKSAETMFTDWLANYPSSSLAPNAEYWLGECFYSQARYGEAILAFQNVAALYPKHDKAPAALLKTGYSYERLADKQNAVFYLQQLLEDYPKSDPAAQARAALKRLQ